MIRKRTQRIRKTRVTMMDGFECVLLRDGNTDGCHMDCSNCGDYGDCSICVNYDYCDFNSHDTMCIDYNRG